MRLKKKSQRGISAVSSKKGASARDAQRPTRKETYIAPSKAQAQRFASPPRLSYLLLPRSWLTVFFARLGRIKWLSLIFRLMGPPDLCPGSGPLYSPNLK